MALEVDRETTFEHPADAVWSLLSDQGERAETVGFVRSYEVRGDDAATWQVEFPIPLTDGKFPMEMTDEEKEPPRHLVFRGDSEPVELLCELWLDRSGGGSRIRVRLRLEGNLPGVETFLRGSLDGELRNIFDGLRTRLDGQD